MLAQDFFQFSWILIIRTELSFSNQVLKCLSCFFFTVVILGLNVYVCISLGGVERKNITVQEMQVVYGALVNILQN